MPCILVNDGVTPPTAALYDGAIVREKTSGKTWEARKNGGGTFDPKWIVYPWNIRAAVTGPVLSSGTGLQHIGVGGFIGGINSSGAAITGSPGTITVPVTGIYVLKSLIVWGNNNTGARISTFIINGSTPLPETEISVQPATGTTTRQINHDTRELAANDTVGVWGWQNSGGGLSADTFTHISLSCPRTP